MTTKTHSSHTDGLLVVDKPAGWTSHDVVARCRRIVGQKRVGHAGTLDPCATGVLLVGLGRATRLMRFVGELQKSYVGEVVLGIKTDTLDDEGEVVEVTSEFVDGDVSLEEFRDAAAGFVGDIEQIPPMVSAVKVDGKRLHALARAGIEVERKARPVTVHSIECFETADRNVFRIEVVCSSGTYIRSLAADIGEKLAGGGHLRRLRRTAIGPFTLDRAAPLEDLAESWEQRLLSPADMVSHLAPVRPTPAVLADIAHGRPGAVSGLAFEGSGPWAVLDENGNLMAVYESVDGRPQAAVVLGAK